MLLNEDQVKTKEVLEWNGLHLLHFSMSSCSQKVRILLREKVLDWASHPINLVSGEQKSAWFLGINPNGVVPVLVHDGQVHVESNDILIYLDETFPSAQGSYLPSSAEERSRAQRFMDLEDELHADLRIVTFSFVAPGNLMKGAEQITDREVDLALSRFQSAFEALDQELQNAPYLCGERMMLPDIAWFISTHRLALGGYPLENHARLNAWYEGLLRRPALSAEVAEGAFLPRFAGSAFRWLKRVSGRSIRHRLQG